MTAPGYHAPRLIVDVSSLARWTGPPVGIARVEHALARAARDRPGTVLSFFDHQAATFRTLAPAWAETVTGWAGMIDVPAPRPRRWLPTRGPLVRSLERWRLTRPGPSAALADAAQRALLGLRKHGTPLHDPAGRRIARLPPDLALGPDAAPGPGDVLFTAGSGWAHLDAGALARLKQARGFRYATLCYDLIPLTHERFWHPADVAAVRKHWLAHLRLADLVIVNACCIADDVHHLATTNGIAPPPTLVLPLGYDPPGPHAPSPPPNRLQPGRYALFVSTVEPRKGHAMLIEAWNSLLRRGIPQRHGFHLVFIGRPGWMVDSVVAALADPANTTILHLAGLGEDALDAAYRNAAFCLYPSVYEGFGLPVIEAFARGKAVLASTGGALPETVAGLSPCLPPEDPAAWADAMAEWIEHPARREACEAKVRAGFSHPGWPDAARAILEAAASTQRRPHPEQP